MDGLTEADLWKLAAQPAIFAIAMLSFLKASWRVRLLAAALAAAAGLAIGLFAMWAESSGIPWLGWVLAAPLVAIAGWRLITRRWASFAEGSVSGGGPRTLAGPSTSRGTRDSFAERRFVNEN